MTSADSVLLSAVKVIHIWNGIYLWEYVTTLSFEIEIFTGRRPWRWSFAAYFLARILALGSVILTLIGFNMRTEFNCNAWFRCVLVFSWAAAAASSFLLALRAIAIWGRNRFVMALAGFVWSGNIGAAAYSVSQGHSEWVAAAQTCSIAGTNAFRWSILVNTIEDTLLLVFMIVGVLKKRNHTGLWRMLYFQGLAWVAAAAASEIPAVILLFLNINDGWNLMFQVPHMVIIVIIATRVYRNLFEYIIGESDSRPNSKWSRDAARFRKREGEGVHITVHRTVDVDVDIELSSVEQHGPGEQGDSVDSDVKAVMFSEHPARMSQEELEEHKMKQESYLGI
ncbi:hypothetical protein FA95DRAFT_1553855 [Auriscalpium vulgare]|uniref:Uncharacterized protein n=1 Tax=Auriscalpium vulgare TaxID=40419 RepID=A0ACB8S6H0_9AGAM|nr:hypothetical protein FA95DRAFT_1553855 [Auriscalpium vulgare]